MLILEKKFVTETISPKMTFEELKGKRWFKVVNSIFNFLLKQWFFILLGVFIALSHSYPEFAKLGGTIRAEYSIGYGAVAVIFLVSGLSMSSKQLAVNFLNWRAHFTVLTTSFLITTSIIYGLVCGIRSAHDHKIDEWLLAGLIVTHSCPTTVSSNVVMTKQADGNDVLTLLEVFIGNILGAFITPALIQMYTTGPWSFANPRKQPTGDSTVLDLYREDMKQLGLSVFIPLFVGQVVQNVFPSQTKWCLTTFRLSKVGSFMLLLIMFQSFSTAFAQHAFTSVSHVSIIFLVFFNIGIYLFFTVICYFYSRPKFILMIFKEEPNETHSKFYRHCYKIFRPFYYNKKDSVAIMLCGPAKTAALGVSLVSSQYGSTSPSLGKILVPLVLYQAEQVMTAQILVRFMKKWIHYDDPKPSDLEDGNKSLEPSESSTDIEQSEFHKNEIPSGNMN